eukprot:11694674-Alexandrium_andersonii.AAC.1
MGAARQRGREQGAWAWPAPRVVVQVAQVGVLGIVLRAVLEVLLADHELARRQQAVDVPVLGL